MENNESESIDLTQTKCETSDLSADNKIDEKETNPIEGPIENDVYSYTKRGEFTSEMYKIEVQNLPKHIGYNCMKKFMKNLGLNPLKIKLINNVQSPHAFVTFRNDNDRDSAIFKLDQHQWKHKTLNVKKANPIPDPLIEKRKAKSDVNDDSNGNENTKKFKSDDPVIDESEAINNQVTPLWKCTIDDQLGKKKESLNTFLRSLRTEITHLDKRLFKTSKLFQWNNMVKDKYDGLCCQIEDIIKSPQEFGYRNKCEFTVGLDKSVGFRLGLYKSGSMKVIPPPDNCPIISDKMRKALNLAQRYIRDESTLQGFNPETHFGHWKQVNVRTTNSDCMIILLMNPQTLTIEEINDEKEKIINFLKSNAESDVSSVFLHISNKRHEVSRENLHHICFEQYIYESMRNGELRFRISPLAFFQINTFAAEICYQMIGQLASVTPESVILDVCCGTGTIGLYMASKVKRVIGIERSKEGVEDARENATINGITNIEFVCGRVENETRSTIAKIIDEEKCDNLNIIAIIDPPRAGIHKSVIQTLRGTESINRIVYVSCEPELAKKNFLELCRPKSSTYRGEPFVPIRAVPIDMFPHTKHFELLLLFERLK